MLGFYTSFKEKKKDGEEMRKEKKPSTGNYSFTPPSF